MLRYVAAIGEFNAMIYIPPIRAGKVSAMRKICELWFRGTRGKNIDHLAALSSSTRMRVTTSNASEI